MARKTKLTEEKLPIIKQCVELGMSYAATAGAINVTPETFNNWLNWGKSGEKAPIYCRFYAIVREAESKLMMDLLTNLKKVNDTAMNPQSIQWLLERRFPDAFSKRSVQDMKVTSESVNTNINVKSKPEEVEAARKDILNRIIGVTHKGSIEGSDNE